MADGLAKAQSLKPGSGSVTLGALLTPTFQGGALGYQHHILQKGDTSLAAFAQAQAGLLRGVPDFAAMTGIELRF